jgi:hypothetical protein
MRWVTDGDIRRLAERTVEGMIMAVIAEVPGEGVCHESTRLGDDRGAGGGKVRVETCAPSRTRRSCDGGRFRSIGASAK